MKQFKKCSDMKAGDLKVISDNIFVVLSVDNTNELITHITFYDTRRQKFNRVNLSNKLAVHIIINNE